MRPYYNYGFERQGPQQMRFGFGVSAWTPSVKYIIIVTCVMYVFQMILKGRGADSLIMPLVLYPPDLLKGKIWQLVTYTLLHDPDNLWHIIWNMFGLWMFGRDVERALGTGRFVALYVLAGIAGGIANGLFRWDSLVVGASGSVYGVVAAFGALYPKRMVLFLFFPMYARTMVIIFVIMSVFGSGGSGIAHSAHLGGLAFGWFFVRTQARWEGLFKRRTGWEPGGTENDDVSVEDEVETDRLLAKIKADGLHSLNWREKRFLDRISQKLRNR